MDYQKLFNYMRDEHHVILIETDMQEICKIVNEMQANELRQPLVSGSLLRYVQRVTALKLQASLARLKRRQWPVAPILCADTTVALGRKILGKPASDAEARAMLQDLSGRDHRVLTAVTMGQGRRTVSMLSQSRVRFASLTSAWINAYVASGEPQGKAGAYAIQGRASMMVSSISGSYSGIMGLPLYETGQLLRSFGFKL